jgi:hypothetical protein
MTGLKQKPVYEVLNKISSASSNSGKQPALNRKDTARYRGGGPEYQSVSNYSTLNRKELLTLSIR